MLVSGAVVLIATLIVLVEYQGIRKMIGKKDLLFFLLFLLIGTGLNILNGLHVKMPSSIGWLIIVYQPISDVFTRFFSVGGGL